jgi:hypothetical protein
MTWTGKDVKYFNHEGHKGSFESLCVLCGKVIFIPDESMSLPYTPGGFP